MRLGYYWVHRMLLGFILAMLSYLFLTLLLGLISTRAKVETCRQRQSVFVTTNGQHLFLILTPAQLDPAFWSELNVPANVRHVAFGWGERAFYLNTPTWGDLRLGVALHALFLPSASAMHVFYPRRGADWIELTLCPGQLEAMVTFIGESFDRNEAGKLLPIPSPMYPPDQRFYEARGTYWLGYTCNNWVNTALKRAGVSTAVWSPFDRGVLYHLKD